MMNYDLSKIIDENLVQYGSEVSNSKRSLPPGAKVQGTKIEMS